MVPRMGRHRDYPHHTDADGLGTDAFVGSSWHGGTQPVALCDSAKMPPMVAAFSGPELTANKRYVPAGVVFL